MKPLDVSETDIQIILQHLLLADKRSAMRAKIQCLEWGAGGSTIQFPQFIRRAQREFWWHTAEHSPEWRDKVQHEAQRLGLFEVNIALLNANANAKEQPMTEYIQFPLMIGKRFDFVFVDGRKRRRCLITASKVLAPGGVVVLHDAEREYYHSAFEHYTSHERVGDKLWIGRVDI